IAPPTPSAPARRTGGGSQAPAGISPGPPSEVGFRPSGGFAGVVRGAAGGMIIVSAGFFFGGEAGGTSAAGVCAPWRRGGGGASRQFNFSVGWATCVTGAVAGRRDGGGAAGTVGFGGTISAGRTGTGLTTAGGVGSGSGSWATSSASRIGMMSPTVPDWWRAGGGGPGGGSGRGGAP